MKKCYNKPMANVIDLETEALMAASAPGLLDTPANGTDAGAKVNEEGTAFDLWATDEEE